MKILHVSRSLVQGGAARAACRIIEAQRIRGMKSFALTLNQEHPEYEVPGFHRSKLERLRIKVNPLLEAGLSRMIYSPNEGLRSVNLLSSISRRQIELEEIDLVNLHWINGGTLSSFNVARISKPLVWTFHDSWAVLGTRHYDYQNRSSEKSTKNIERLDVLWQKMKQSLWQSRFTIVAPSHWMKNEVEKSALGLDRKIEVIPYPIDTEFWKRIRKDLARSALGLPQDIPIVLFGAAGDRKDPRKGLDLFLKSIKLIRRRVPEVEFVIFGMRLNEEVAIENEIIHNFGEIRDDLLLRMIYSAADVFLMPSRHDNLPSAAIESQACETPVVAFSVGGIPDILDHLKTGYLATAESLEELVEGVIWSLNEVNRGRIGSHCRNSVLKKFSQSLVATKYKNLYEHILEGGGS